MINRILEYIIRIAEFSKKIINGIKVGFIELCRVVFERIKNKHPLVTILWVIFIIYVLGNIGLILYTNAQVGNHSVEITSSSIVDSYPSIIYNVFIGLSINFGFSLISIIFLVLFIFVKIIFKSISAEDKNECLLIIILCIFVSIGLDIYSGSSYNTLLVEMKESTDALNDSTNSTENLNDYFDMGTLTIKSEW